MKPRLPQLGWRILVAALTLQLVSACNVGSVYIRSPQVSFLLGLLPDGERGDVLGEFEWKLTWAGAESQIYPVQTETAILFVNYDDVVITYDGWGLVRVEGLIPDARMRIERSHREGEPRERLSVYANDRRLKTLTCDTWQTRETSTGLLHTRRCDERAHVDSIALDKQGNIVKMHFQIHPDYAPILLEPVANLDATR